MESPSLWRAKGFPQDDEGGRVNWFVRRKGNGAIAQRRAIHDVLGKAEKRRRSFASSRSALALKGAPGPLSADMHQVTKERGERGVCK